MGNGTSASTIEIADVESFPDKVTRIREAAAGLDAIAEQLRDIAETARTETTQFTRDGAPAPIYAEAVDGLQAWARAAATLTRSVATQAHAAAETVSEKYTAFTATDTAGARAINRT